MRIKKVFISIILTLIFIILPSALSLAKTIKVGIYDNKPVMFQDNDGSYKGISIDILVYIAMREDWELEFIDGTWSECLERLSNGVIDVMPGIAYTKERDEIFDFTKEDFSSTWARVYSNQNVEFTNILSLKNKKVALLRRDFLANNFHKLMTSFNLDYSPIYTNSYQESAKLIEEGKVNAGIFERISVIDIKLNYDLKETNIIFSPTGLLYAVAENKNDDILETIDKYLIQLKNDDKSIYYENLEKYFYIEEIYESPLWLKILMGALIIITVFFIGTIAYSRRQVNIKTKELSEKNKQLKQRIEERIKIEKELKIRNNFIEEVLLNLPIGVAVETMDFDFSSIRRFTNKKFEEIFGYSGKDFNNLNDFLNLVYPDRELKSKMDEKFLNEVINSPHNVVKWESVNVMTKYGEKVVSALFILLKKQNLLILTIQDVTQKIKAENQIKASLKEKETLIKEIHHRVKNNMQVISSILNLQTRYMSDEHITQVLEECKMRINSMSIIHENLYRNDNLALINFLEYSGSLISEIIGSYNIDKIIDRKIDIDEEIYFDIETAIPCGLIINEVITNSIKYAFNDSNEGNLILNFHRSKVNGTTKYVMEVGDDGSGIPESIDINKTKTLGIHLIRILVRQLKGEVELFRENGTLYKITFFR